MLLILLAEHSQEALPVRIGTLHLELETPYDTLITLQKLSFVATESFFMHTFSMYPLCRQIYC